ncbi:hypothetical protein [Fervidibacillus albus]|uniref:Uncharacterized protein n=1 Tax=Fervidibacillus albus TaxID=2980026 RepID=A0A9E8RWY1_9BACI|nr:hypothetical protein [Fervidibacillus albus]WAA08927.1 hypothetical protein OE104_09950 [Fervidibacillus albus]
MLNSVILSLLASIGLLTFILVIGTFFKEFGDWQYPILYYDHPSIVQELNYTGTKSAFGLGFHFMFLGDYLIKTTTLFAFILTFTIVLAIFLSMFIKNVFTNYAITILIVVLGYIGSINILKDFAYLSLFTYFQIFRITNGELSIVLDHPSINFLTGSIVLITSISILTILGYWIKHKSVGSFKNTSELETEKEMEKVRHITDEK